MVIRTYTELSRLTTFEERYEYLKLAGIVGEVTFGFDRYLNQSFYRMAKWKAIRNAVIVRDGACDLGVDGYDLTDRIIIHHMNPIAPKNIEENEDLILDPEYLICVSHRTHNAIHYGDESQLLKNKIVERSRFDTCPWRR